MNLELSHCKCKNQTTTSGLSETQLVQTPNTPDPVQQMVETPLLERDDQNYTP